MNPEIPEKLKKLRDASVAKLNFSKGEVGYDLLISMTDALYAEGHAAGIKGTIELFKLAFDHDPKIKKIFDNIIKTFEDREAVREKAVNKALGEKEDKLKN